MAFLDELLVVIAGTASNIAVFIVMILVSFFTKWITDIFPRLYYKVICFFGVYTVLDPFLILIVDAITYNMGSSENGDWFRLYNYY